MLPQKLDVKPGAGTSTGHSSEDMISKSANSTSEEQSLTFQIGTASTDDEEIAHQ